MAFGALYSSNTCWC